MLGKEDAVAEDYTHWSTRGFVDFNACGKRCRRLQAFGECDGNATVIAPESEMDHIAIWSNCLSAKLGTCATALAFTRWRRYPMDAMEDPVSDTPNVARIQNIRFATELLAFTFTFSTADWQ